MLRRIIYVLSVATLLFVVTGIAVAQNPLFIPDTLTGTIFNLNVQKGVVNFFTGINTPTFGYNGNILGPTLIINKGDSITLNVTNNLTNSTTVHWHGFHVAPQYDGGPHQIIDPTKTWSPSFKMLNNAGTYWYHPHGENKTEIQVSKGLAGLIIVRDKTEASYKLPRKYGVDDFPVIIQTKAFDVLYQIATANHEDTLVLVNATVNPYLQVPKQMVRLRLLNGSTDRTYNIGISDSRTFYLITTDGGLLSQPYPMNRLRLSTGERAEILVDFGSDSIGKQLFLKSYSSELPTGIIGADSVGTSTIVIGEGYHSNDLNGADFNLMRFDIKASTTNSVTTVPVSFSPLDLFDTLNVNAHRQVHFSADVATFGDQARVDGPFMMNDKSFHMDSINIITYLNNKEIWTLTNSTMVAHPFHIHDIQFSILDINGSKPPPEYSGWKDVILVKPDDTVRFITKFTTFANKTVPYMFHCHLLHHEDEGMMGSFLVLDTNATGLNPLKFVSNIVIYPNPSNGNWTIKGTQFDEKMDIELLNSGGQIVVQKTLYIDSKTIEIHNATLEPGIYIIKVKVNNSYQTYKLIKN